MKVYLYSLFGEKLLAMADSEPECGVDFCDGCGDCLYCYPPPHGDEYCHNSRWVIYEDDERIGKISWNYL